MAQTLRCILWGKRDGWWILRLGGCWGEDSNHMIKAGAAFPKFVAPAF